MWYLGRWSVSPPRVFVAQCVPGSLDTPYFHEYVKGELPEVQEECLKRLDGFQGYQLAGGRSVSCLLDQGCWTNSFHKHVIRHFSISLTPPKVEKPVLLIEARHLESSSARKPLGNSEPPGSLKVGVLEGPQLCVRVLASALKGLAQLLAPQSTTHCQTQHGSKKKEHSRGSSNPRLLHSCLKCLVFIFSFFSFLKFVLII